MPPATVWNEADARGKFFYEFEIPKKGISEYGTAHLARRVHRSLL